MEEATAKGVLSHLSSLEVQARSRRVPPRQQQSRAAELKAQAAALLSRRERLRAELHALQDLQKCRKRVDDQCANEGEEEERMEEDTEKSELLTLVARQTQLKDLLRAHHIIGGYDVTKTRNGKGVCVALATAYEGVYLDTYNLEMDVAPTLRICRHNIPPFIPLSTLAEQSHMQTDIRAFLDALSRHLNAFAGRRQQSKLVKELHKSVQVMESNVLGSILVLMFTVPKGDAAVLCTLDYRDHSRCLPTGVSFECEEKKLCDSHWKENVRLLMETPVHKALTAMKERGIIA